MIRDFENKMLRDEDAARREQRMAEYTRRVRRRFNIVGASLPPSSTHVETAAQPRCDAFRVDTESAVNDVVSFRTRDLPRRLPVLPNYLEGDE